MQMLFADESGTPPPNDQGVPYFVIGGVIISDHLWRNLKADFDEVKKRYGVNGEIKWRFFAPKNNDDSNSLLHLDVVEKESLRNEIFGLITSRRAIKLIAVVASVKASYALPTISNADDLYHYTYKPLTERFQYYLQDLEKDSGQQMNGIIILDHRGPKDDQRIQALHQNLLNVNSEYYSSYGNLIEGLFIAPSHWSVGIQLADMVAGAVYRKFQAKDDRYFDLIKGSFRTSRYSASIDGFGLVKQPKKDWE